ncbi:hypothetical protein X748_15305 [Mesorhizobium sp. LNJC386A00]|nr:hypothetical protein X748_15305 [Mesorhizobium sp. LNJC386A00]
MPAPSVTEPWLTAMAGPPTVIALPLMAVICALPSKLSAPETSLAPLTGLKVMAVSSLVTTVSATMSLTALMVIATVSVSVANPSEVAMVRLSAPL